MRFWRKKGTKITHLTTVVPDIPSLEVSLCMNHCEAGFWRKKGTRTTHLTTVVPAIPSLEVSLCMNRCEAGS